MFLPSPFWHQGQTLHSIMSFPGPGKRKCRRSLAAVSAGAVDKLLFIKNTISSSRLLVDSGAQRSILPVSPVALLANGHVPPLNAANGTSIRTFLTQMRRLCVSIDVGLAGSLSLLLCLCLFWVRIICVPMDSWWMLQTAS